MRTTARGSFQDLVKKPGHSTERERDAKNLKPMDLFAAEAHSRP